MASNHRPLRECNATEFHCRMEVLWQWLIIQFR